VTAPILQSLGCFISWLHNWQKSLGAIILTTPNTGTSAADVTKAFTIASEAASRAVDLLTPEYLEMYDADASKP
jgi:hypothetical protein